MFSFLVIRVAPFLSSQCLTLGSRRLKFNQIIKARSQTGMTPYLTVIPRFIRGISSANKRFR
ncbi:hypothetical protein [Wolbachia endosymbiont of Drosophila tsacasi]|uniref:hypothetical protein n=1 Tax=Wolbachia endosymbiont of Drosophila tsacasi TaxID=3002579 RepID=UPI0023A9D167|nr:hypothetical protein [Wolbachia endosymbiont of Drosophila tsacasi]MDE5062503.1 hypothetical protein [Wolbachia endosymbiont of Drosophila tsacasi]